MRNTTHSLIPISRFTELFASSCVGERLGVHDRQIPGESGRRVAWWIYRHRRPPPRALASCHGRYSPCCSGYGNRPTVLRGQVLIAPWRRPALQSTPLPMTDCGERGRREKTGWATWHCVTPKRAGRLSRLSSLSRRALQRWSWPTFEDDQTGFSVARSVSLRLH
jgi:hypothetical protein